MAMERQRGFDLGWVFEAVVRDGCGCGGWL
jgi:hypothetical protein